MAKFNKPTKKYVVTFGRCVSVYYTDYHAEQMLNALRMNGTPAVLHVEA